ncbi:hypothetical protein [Hyphomicrobium sp.]|uniref:hypothetical protein n=1 Tax=Hyphomicrobium sp. TaxID=82 RepID=UPI003567DD92
MTKSNARKFWIGTACLSPLILGVMALSDAAAQSPQVPAASEESAHGPFGPQFGGDPFGPRFGPEGRPRFGPPRPPMEPQHVAALLAEAETEIGIRAEQLNEWRDFTDALLAITEPPQVPKTESQSPSAEPPKSFALAMQLADTAIERAQKADALKKAIEVLRAKLTPDQLSKVAAIEARLPRREFPPHFAPPPPPGFADGCLSNRPLPHNP